MQIEITHEKLALVLHAIAKREKTTPSEVAERFLSRGFLAVAQEGIAKRAAQRQAKRQPKNAANDDDDRAAQIIVRDPCSEDALRDLCGDDWHLCYFLMTCSIWDD